MKIKKEQFSEWYTEILKEAKLCDIRYGVKGFVVFMPWAVKTMNRMYEIYENELSKKGHMPALFPALIPERFFTKESEHVEGFVPECFWVTEAGGNKLEEKLAMRPTSETAIYSMYSLWVQGKRDLPLKIYQRAQVWRYETKATRPFIRSREFYWLEAHNCFETKEEMKAQVKEDMDTTKAVLFDRFGIPFIFFKRPQWDKFAGAENTYAADTLMPDFRVLQLPSTHELGQNFSKAFNIKYMDEYGEERYVWQTCYGPSISRIYAALISIHGDDKGLVLPFELAPVQIVIVPIFKEETKETVLKEANKLKEVLKEYEVVLDDSEKSPGYKFNYWEMKGVPIRIEIGMRDIENKSVVVVSRDVMKKESVPIEKLVEYIGKERVEMQERLKNKAEKWFKDHIYHANSFEELKKKINRGMVKVPFCSDQLDGKPCADRIKEETHGHVRGINIAEETTQKGKCIICGKESTVEVYISKQY